MRHHGIDVLFKRLSSGLANENQNFEESTVGCRYRGGRRELFKKRERGRLPLTIHADVSPRGVTINIFRMLNGWGCLASVFAPIPALNKGTRF